MVHAKLFIPSKNSTPLSRNKVYVEEVGKDFFLAWFNSGSLKRATQLLTEQGFKSIRGNPLVFVVVRDIVYNWVLEHLSEVREIYNSEGVFLKDSDWYIYIVKLARRQFLGKDEFIDWAVRNKVYEAAFDYFAPLFNLSEEHRSLFKYWKGK